MVIAGVTRGAAAGTGPRRTAALRILLLEGLAGVGVLGGALFLLKLCSEQNCNTEAKSHRGPSVRGLKGANGKQVCLGILFCFVLFLGVFLVYFHFW